jgi:hypothetical protein
LSCAEVFDKPEASPLSFCWWPTSWRLAKDWEKLATAILAFVTLALSQLAIRRLAIRRLAR